MKRLKIYIPECKKYFRSTPKHGGAVCFTVKPDVIHVHVAWSLKFKVDVYVIETWICIYIFLALFSMVHWILPQIGPYT